MKSIIVFYHKACPDGFGAAWAAWKKFGERADYIGLEPREPQIDALSLKGREIYFLDVAPDKKSEIQKILRVAKGVVIIDHHISRREILELVPDSVFDLNHSASVLAWQYFHPKKRLPVLFKYIEDLDIYKLEFSDTEALTNNLIFFDFNFRAWDKLAALFENNSARKKLRDNGRIIAQYIQRLSRILAKEAEPVIFEGSRAAVLNLQTPFDSNIGHIVVEELGFPIAVVWSHGRIGLSVSLYSKNIDVSKIAKKFGGGGHKHAAGFKLKSSQKFPWKKIR